MIKHTIHEMALVCRELALKIEAHGFYGTERLHENATALFADAKRLEKAAQKPQKKGA